ncbi:MAG: PLP-dependent aminotransferase family protein, partial [Nitrospirales bacterium]|nr:PLP-dependent aminotransferase family protein [Nitrospirales bacterium]
MNDIFSDRISDVPRSFIREILKVTLDKTIISFAGGLPNRDLFPVEEIREATMHVFEHDAKDALQYSTTEGYLPLREYIAERYATRHNLKVDPSEILITSGSQQGLDLLGKVFLNEKDDVIIEEPGYLGAIQSFSVYRATFHPVPVEEEGVDVDVLSDILDNSNAKLFYTVPNFQNPSGITYSEENRAAVAQLLQDRSTLLIED